MKLQDLSMSDLLALDEIYFDQYTAALGEKDSKEAARLDRFRDAIGAEFDRREALLFPQGIVMCSPNNRQITAELVLNESNKTEKGWVLLLDGKPIHFSYRNITLKGSSEREILARFSPIEVESIKFTR
jgi:hypothetical protein